MKKLNYITTLLLLSITFAGIAGNKQKDKPNIIIIYADDLGNADVGYHHQRNEIPTPNIDALAMSGVHFSCGYVTAPVCGPSRAGMLTGNYQQSFGFDDNPGPFRANPDVLAGIPVDIPIIPNYLKAEGYKTACIGKWHVGHEGDAFFPTNRGFDYFYGFLGGAANYYPKNNASRTLFINTIPVEYEKEYLTDAFGREAVDYIKQNKNNPFFLYLAFNAVHGPLQTPPEKYMKVFKDMPDSKRKTLCAMQHAMDANVGKITNMLEELGLRENTLIFFVSDNGGKLKGNYSYNDPYKGQKGTLYEGGIRLPYCISWPDKIDGKLTYDKPVSTLDILPTILKAAGINTDKHIEGTDLLPFVTGKTEQDPHQILYWRINHKWAIRDSEWKLVCNDDKKEPELYHISKDKSETENLYNSKPEIVEELKQKYSIWSDKVGKPQWGWNAQTGKFIHHPKEDFEGINTEQCTPINKNTKLYFTENPENTKANPSRNALKIVSEKAQDQFGVSIKVSQFQIRNKILTAKVLMENKSEVCAVLKGKKELKVKADKIQNGTKEWKTLRFDFSQYNGAVNTIKLLFQQKQNTCESLVYVDDICFKGK